MLWYNLERKRFIWQEIGFFENCFIIFPRAHIKSTFGKFLTPGWFSTAEYTVRTCSFDSCYCYLLLLLLLKFFFFFIVWYENILLCTLEYLIKTNCAHKQTNKQAVKIKGKQEQVLLSPRALLWVCVRKTNPCQRLFFYVVSGIQNTGRYKPSHLANSILVFQVFWL